MSVSQDLRHGLHRLRQNAAFSALAVLFLALGIGPTVGVFSLANALWLRPVPGVERVDGLVSLYARERVELPGMEEASATTGLSLPDYLRYREATRTLRHLAGFVPVGLRLAAPGGEARRLEAQFVTDNYFAALNLQPSLGRLFAPGERAPERLAVVSENLWRRELGGGKQLASVTVEVNGQPFVVAGVAPPGFRGIHRGDAVDLWLLPEAMPVVTPAKSRPNLADPETGWFHWLVGRLAVGATARQAQRELDALALQLADPGPPRRRPAPLEVYSGIGVWPWQRGAIARQLALLGSVVLLLMLAVCANLGGLLLVQAAARQDEIGVKLALGVTKREVVRQLLIESLVLAAAGGAVGLLLALAATQSFAGLALAPDLPRLAEIPIDWRVAFFTLGLSLLAGISFGLVPVLWTFRRPLQPLLRQSASGPDPARLKLHESLVVGQVTLSVVLLVATGLLVRTLVNLQAVDPGFEPRPVLNFRFELDERRYDEPRNTLLLDQLLARVRALPEVERASLATAVPLGALEGTGRFGSILPAGGDPAAEVTVDLITVSPGYFGTLGIRVSPGRDFSPADPAPVVVDETVAKRLWPGRSPIGEQVLVSKEPRQVVGVAAAVHLYALASQRDPVAYLPLAGQETSLTLQVRVRGEAAPATSAIAAVKAAIREVDPALPLFSTSRYQDEVEQSLAQPRVLSWLSGTISAIALIVTSLGLYGTLAYTVSRRTRELGIRMALGASASEIVALVVKRGLLLTGSGLALGLGVAVWTTGLLRGFLFGVEPDDPLVFGGTLALLVAIALAASWLPARRAARVDPLAIIRHE